MNINEPLLASVLRIVQSLQLAGSWCAETNIQKTVYIVKEFGSKNLNLDYILYKHGPFSFELREVLAFMHSRRLLGAEVKDESYGPSIVLGPMATMIIDRNESELRKEKALVDFVIQWVGKADIKKLERYSTALMLTKEFPDQEILLKAERLVKIKPHISLSEAQEAFNAVDFRMKTAKEKKIIA